MKCLVAFDLDGTLAAALPGHSVRIGGSTSINITLAEVD